MGRKVENLKRIAIEKGIVETELANPECVKYLKLCLKLEKNTKPIFFDDRYEPNDNDQIYAEE